ncbi:MAG TPA: ArgE/DapE family deacylase [Solirubrobacteraceae bacterium]|nr:ArgE/DapE family deacylase [Solirubrobacteraceae bacterium]
MSRAAGLTEAEITAAAAAETEWMVDVLERLVAAPTVLGAEEAGQAVMESALRDVGLEPRDVWMDADALRADPGSSPFSWDVSTKRNVVATWEAGAAGGRSLILGGHVDVVPPAAEELWSSPPFEPRREGDWLYGRGAGDMKSGLVAIAGALRALRGLGVAPCADVHVQSVVEEECTGNGALQCLLSGQSADACVIAEPHPDHIMTAQVGVLWAHVDIAGRPAHAARASEAGFNAIDAAATVTRALRELEVEMNAVKPPPFDAFPHPINLNPGVIEGGDWASTVAARCTVSYRLAMYPGQTPAEVAARVEAAVAAAAAANPFLAENPPRVRYDGFRCEGFALAPDEPVALSLADAYRRVVGTEAPQLPTTATTDARHFVRRGIPAVCFGPLAEEIHGIDERVSIASMQRAAQVMAVFVRDWCGLVGG